ncbi:hypothetical protein JTE90_007441 [Oedothorax gibbosus]|uniref:Glucose-methanol-choline oxidoreductase N-terminal domain-containing protein n=1 Tax=Oedothorax gibbosus TaxID=931172 RepID=A0AAV6UPE1_9ARAC|nr:hypothetical protein JTE90_007441 [Oedothorax gibbosus]
MSNLQEAYLVESTPLSHVIWERTSKNASRTTKHLPWARGLPGLGGSSLLNFFMYVRGNRRDYDAWEREVAEALPSTGALLSVSSAQYNSTLMTAFAKAASERDYGYRDINRAKKTGYSKLQGTIRNGRCSTAKAFLIPAQDRENLYIVNNVHVTKIPLIADLPVGDNLQDHVGTHALNFEASQAKALLLGTVTNPVNVQKFAKEGKGPLTSFSGIEGMAYISSKFIDPKLDWPEMEIHLAFGSPASDYELILKDAIGVTDQVKGVRNLRVVDCSVMLSLVRNTAWSSMVEAPQRAHHHECRESVRHDQSC